MQRHDCAAEHLAAEERDQGPQDIATQNHGKGAGDDGGDLEVCP
jgi:hypothetical protein